MLSVDDAQNTCFPCKERTGTVSQLPAYTLWENNAAIESEEMCNHDNRGTDS